MEKIKQYKIQVIILILFVLVISFIFILNKQEDKRAIFYVDAFSENSLKFKASGNFDFPDGYFSQRSEINCFKEEMLCHEALIANSITLSPIYNRYQISNWDETGIIAERERGDALEEIVYDSKKQIVKKIYYSNNTAKEAILSK